jgi:rhomboid family GlyGly-CTERM serine protease
VRLTPRWQAGLALALLALIASVLPDAVAALAWQRGAIADGQWARLFTAHFAHLDAHHLFFNLLGLALIVDLLLEHWTWSELAPLIAGSALGCGLLLWYVEPELQWYTGLSGLLHGLWAGAALHGCLTRRGRMPLAALLALAIKLVWMNQSSGPMPVLPIAHVYGALSGILCTLMRRVLIVSPFRLE